MYQICIITVRKRSLGLGNIFTSVCFSTGGLCSGVSVQQGISVQARTETPLTEIPGQRPGSLSGEGFCHRDTPPPVMVEERAVRILLEWILVDILFTDGWVCA